MFIAKKKYWWVKGNITTGLQLYLPFNGNANDASGNGRNGTVTGATLTTDYANNANSAYAFDRSALKVITVADSDAFTFNDGTNDKPFSVSVVIKPTQRANHAVDYEFAILAKYFYPQTEWQFFDYTTDGGSTGYYNFICCGNGVASNRIGITIPYTSVPLNQFSLITITYKGTKIYTDIKAYVNGNRVGTNYYSGSYTGMSNSTAPVEIGACQAKSANGFVGTIDSVRIYSKELTQDDVLLLVQTDLKP